MDDEGICTHTLSLADNRQQRRRLQQGNGQMHVFQKALRCVKVITSPLSVYATMIEGSKQHSIVKRRLKRLASEAEICSFGPC